MRFRRRFLWALATIVLLSGAGYLLLTHPQTPLPRAWNPVEPLRVVDPVTPFTGWKLSRALADDGQCFSTLTEAGAVFQRMDDLEVSAQCHIRPRISLSQLGIARLAPVETRCQTALRLAMWERHGLVPALEAEGNGRRLTEIAHISSYNCRPIRTSAGTGRRMSTHATADAIDIAGFSFSDGTRLRLLDDWNGSDRDADFLRAARDSACDWFGSVLGPDYNRLHANHFHFQNRGWGTCR